MIEPDWTTLPFDLIVRARRLLREGWGLREVARHLRVGSQALDCALWQWIEVSA